MDDAQCSQICNGIDTYIFAYNHIDDPAAAASQYPPYVYAPDPHWSERYAEISEIDAGDNENQHADGDKGIQCERTAFGQEVISYIGHEMQVVNLSQGEFQVGKIVCIVIEYFRIVLCEIFQKIFRVAAVLESYKVHIIKSTPVVIIRGRIHCSIYDVPDRCVFRKILVYPADGNGFCSVVSDQNPSGCRYTFEKLQCKAFRNHGITGSFESGTVSLDHTEIEYIQTAVRYCTNIDCQIPSGTVVRHFVQSGIG